MGNSEYHHISMPLVFSQIPILGGAGAALGQATEVTCEPGPVH